MEIDDFSVGWSKFVLSSYLPIENWFSIHTHKCTLSQKKINVCANDLFNLIHIVILSVLQYVYFTSSFQGYVYFFFEEENQSIRLSIINASFLIDTAYFQTNFVGHPSLSEDYYQHLQLITSTGSGRPQLGDNAYKC